MLVKLKLLRSPNREFFQVAVYSQTKPGLKAVNEVERTHKERKITALAAASCAEYLNETYADRIDPDACAIETEKLYDGIISRQEGKVINDDLPLA